MTSPVYIILLLYYIRQFHVAVGLFSSVSQKIQMWKEHPSVTHLHSAGVPLFFSIPHLGVMCDLSRNRRTATFMHATFDLCTVV